MPIRSAEAEWHGTVAEGDGKLKLGSGAFNGPYSFKSRFADGAGTNPEELMGASHAGCFTMAFSLILGNAGHPPTRLHTTAKVHLEKAGDGFAIPRIDLETEGEVPGIDDAQFKNWPTWRRRTARYRRRLLGSTST